MSYKLSWMIPRRVILLEVEGDFDDNMLREGDAAIIKMLEEGDPDAALIHQIVIISEITSKPSLKMIPSTTAPKHPRMGWLVAVGINNPLMKMVLNIGSQIVKMRVRNMNSVEEALVFLYKVDSTLPQNLTTIEENVP